MTENRKLADSRGQTKNELIGMLHVSISRDVAICMYQGKTHEI